MKMSVRVAEQFLPFSLFDLDNSELALEGYSLRRHLLCCTLPSVFLRFLPLNSHVVKRRDFLLGDFLRMGAWRIGSSTRGQVQDSTLDMF